MSYIALRWATAHENENNLVCNSSRATVEAETWYGFLPVASMVLVSNAVSWNYAVLQLKPQNLSSAPWHYVSWFY